MSPETLRDSPAAVDLSAVRPADGHAVRKDIQGLRALAVLSVAVNHLTHHPSGGFVGVDVFFVISGYLITGLLAREATATGRISFRDFYVRRAKRILPAAALVLSATVTASWIVYYAAPAKAVTVDSVWSLLFLGNWRFAALGTNYMNASVTPSPVQHYWSLGVEEQFYIVWPWLILAALFVAGLLKAGGRRRSVIVAAAVLIPTAASYAYAVWQSNAEPNVAYFSTFSRGWELGVGALLAVTTAKFRGFPLWVRWLLFWAGLGAIAASLAVINSRTPFPAPWAALPVFGAAAVILGGVGFGDDEDRRRAYDRGVFPLTNPLAGYVGKISYSFYLWHFPVIVLMGGFFRDGSGSYYGLAMAAMAALSIASFHLVEDPIRRSSLGKRPRTTAGRTPADQTLAEWTSTDQTSADQPRPRTGSPKRKEWSAVAALTAVVLAAPAVAYACYDSSGSQNLAATPQLGPEARTQALIAALHTNRWPALNPDPATLTRYGDSAKAPEWVQDGCLGGQLSTVVRSKDTVENAEHCVYGSPTAPNTMVVFGDSTTISYVPGIRKALEGRDWRVYVYTVAACTPTLVPDPSQDGAIPECAEFKTWVEQQIAQIGPTMVVSSFSRNDHQLKDKATGTAADAEWTNQIDAMGAYVLKYSQSYVMLSPPMPNAADPGRCITRFSKPSDCVTNETPDFRHQLVVLAQAMAALGPKAKFVDGESWFCQDGQCPAFIGNTLIFADELHYTAAASTELGPELRTALLGP